ncbi:hypothetical protein FOCC_FOCC004238 [Frankliniella occidentalis]|nr:hypothetical protein FOCC_FOCC004238 [Frankliniella occidentalis]
MYTLLLLQCITVLSKLICEKLTSRDHCTSTPIIFQELQEHCDGKYSYCTSTIQHVYGQLCMYSSRGNGVCCTECLDMAP